MNFRDFILESDKNMQDVKGTLSRIPKKHSVLVKNYKFKFQPDNCLKGDGGHVGVVDDSKKTITIAAPWNYGREFTTLHEIGHLVWRTLSQNKQNTWKKIVKPYLKKLNDNAEEVFCMIYANKYCSNPVIKFDISSLNNFIKSI